MGFWKKFGKIASIAAPIIAAPFTGGLSLLAIGAGAGAAGGLLNGGGWKGALMGAGLGAIPGAGGTGGLAKGAIAPTLATGLKQVGKNALTSAATNFGTGAAGGALTGGGVKGALTGGLQGTVSGIGQAGGAGGLKTALTGAAKNAALTLGPRAGMGLAAHYLGGPGAPGGANPGNPSTYSEFLGRDGGAGGGTSLSRFLPQPQGSGIGSGESGGMGSNNSGGNPWLSLASQGLNLIGNRGTGGSAPTGTQPTFGGGSGGIMNAAPAGQPGFWGKYGPLIAQGGGMVAGGIAGSIATKNAQKRSPEEARAVAGGQAQADAAGNLGGSLAQQGQQNIAGPANYYQTLLSGNRAAMSQAVAPAASQITDNYTGAARALEHSGMRGAARDNATAELNRSRVAQIAGLTTGVQPGAASALASIGQGQLGLAPGLMSTSGQLYGNQVNQGYENRVYGRKEGEKTAAAIGGLARDVGETVFNKDGTTAGQTGQTGSTTKTTKAKATTRAQGPSGPVPGPGLGSWLPNTQTPPWASQQPSSRFGTSYTGSPYSFAGAGDYAPTPQNRWGY